MRQQLSILSFLLVGISVYSQDLCTAEKSNKEDYINRQSYAFSYNESYELSSWVAYQLTTNEALTSTEVKIKYDEDDAILTKTAKLKDYKKSGYSPAQLIPAENFIAEPDIIEQLGFFTNIAPMKPGFYTMTWKNLEKLFRAWSILDSTNLYIIAGPILTDAPFQTIGDNNVSIPKRYFKAVYDPKNKRSVAFILKNTYQTNSFSNYAISIDELEDILKLDLFIEIEDSVEDKIEATFKKEDWNWEAIQTVYPE